MKNNRTFLDKLLDGAEVEWKPLKKVCNFISTGKLNANAMDENGIYPFFTCNEKPYKINNYAFDMEAILISGNGSQVGHLNYFKGKFNAYQRTYVIGEFDNNTLVMYLYHYLNFKLRDYITINSKKGSVPYITLPMLEKFEIPIPPLSVQTEIVRILDALTALTSELTSELTLRRKQYEYYREKLLSEEELGKVGFEWKPLKEIAEYIRGVTYNKTNESPNNIGYKILRANNITLSSNTLNFDDIKVIKFDTKVKSSQMLYKNDILISAASGSREHVGKVAFIYQDIDYYFGGFMGVIRCNNNVNSRYLFHIFTSSIFQDYLNEVLNSSTINNLNSKVMDSFRLPIPPLSVQTEIVKILDKFENLTNSITEGLPLAIEQSQKRYEYYRELLLNFNNT